VYNWPLPRKMAKSLPMRVWIVEPHTLCFTRSMPGEWYGICQCWTAISTSMLPMFFKASRRRLLHVNVLHLGPRPDTYLFCRYTSLPYTPHAWLPRSFISVVAMSRAVLLAENHWFDVHSMSFAFRGEVNQLQMSLLQRRLTL
jgi:hypothetical protein